MVEKTAYDIFDEEVAEKIEKCREIARGYKLGLVEGVISEETFKENIEKLVIYSMELINEITDRNL